MRTATTTFVSALVLAASVAVAQQVTWQQLVERGLALHAAHHDEQATDMFQRAYAQSSAPMALGQLAVSEQRLGRWLDADAHMTTVLATSGDRWVDAHRHALSGALELIRTHLGGIQVLGGVSGAVVRIDGRVRATLPMDHPIRAEAGSAVVEVVAAGYYTVTRNVIVTVGDVAQETVNLVPVAAAQVAGPPPTPPPRDEDTPAQPPLPTPAAPVATDPAILAAVRTVAPAIRTCLGGVQPYGFLVVTYGPDGGVISAHVEGGLNGSAVGACVVQRATGVLFPPSSGPAFTARISLRDVIAPTAATTNTTTTDDPAIAVVEHERANGFYADVPGWHGPTATIQRAQQVSAALSQRPDIGACWTAEHARLPAHPGGRLIVRIVLAPNGSAAVRVFAPVAEVLDTATRRDVQSGPFMGCVENIVRGMNFGADVIGASNSFAVHIHLFQDGRAALIGVREEVPDGSER